MHLDSDLILFHSGILITMQPERSSTRHVHQEVFQPPATVPREGSDRLGCSGSGTIVNRQTNDGERRGAREGQSHFQQHHRGWTQ